MSVEDHEAIIRELKGIRQAMVALVLFGACGLLIVAARLVLPGPTPNGPELNAIREEVRQMREELQRYHRPSQLAPGVIPAVK